MSLERYSEAGQDVFAYQIVGEKGTFLDIGAGHPTEFSNSYGLEKLGWRGLSVELSGKFQRQWQDIRHTPLLLADAMTVNWAQACGSHDLYPRVNYLSLDIDEHPDDSYHPEWRETPRVLFVLRDLITSGMKFDTITVEHDAYYLGDFVRKRVRSFLEESGYNLFRADVGYQDGLGPAFEDWFVLKDRI